MNASGPECPVCYQETKDLAMDDGQLSIYCTRCEDSFDLDEYELSNENFITLIIEALRKDVEEWEIMTYDEVGMLTLNKGIVIRTPFGQDFNLTLAGS